MLKVEYQGAVVTCDTVDEAVAFVRGVTPVTSVGFETGRFVIYDPRHKPVVTEPLEFSENNGWTKWCKSGFEQPVPDGTIVNVIFSDGSGGGNRKAEYYDWSRSHLAAYRVVGSN